MKSFVALASALALAAPASARISGIAVPATIAPGSNVNVTIETEDFSQSVEDVAISFGFAPATSLYSGSLGTFLSSRYIGPNESNIDYNISHVVSIPASASNGPAIFSGTLFSLIGVIYSPSIEDFTVNVTIGDTTDSSKYISSSAS